MSKSEVIRKVNPCMKRRNIQVLTLNNIKSFLKEQEQPIYKSEIVRHLVVDYNSLNFALNMLPIKIDEKGRISLDKRSKIV